MFGFAPFGTPFSAFSSASGNIYYVSAIAGGYGGNFYGYGPY